MLTSASTCCLADLWACRGVIVSLLQGCDLQRDKVVTTHPGPVGTRLTFQDPLSLGASLLLSLPTAPRKPAARLAACSNVFQELRDAQATVPPQARRQSQLKHFRTVASLSLSLFFDPAVKPKFQPPNQSELFDRHWGRVR